MKRITSLFLLLLFSAIVEAQTILVKGKVSDSQKNALKGVTVGIEGTSIVTQTRNDGTYQIYSTYGDTLVFTSSLGMSETIAVSNKYLDFPNNYLVIDVELAIDNQIFNLSLEELMSIKITTASNVSEKLNDAPATIIVLTQKQILDMGYIKLSDILDDLPGMDMVKTYGDTYYKNYWRGFRNSVGTAYLLLVDGMLQNQLWTNTDQIMAAIPVSNIERVEVVYGPASSVYGANALMGVINVLTKKTADTDGTHLSFQSFRSASNYFTGDYNVFYQRSNIRFSVTGRVEDGDVNEFINSNDFYWTRDEHYSNPALWGDVVNNKNLGGLFSSPERNRALGFRLYMDD
ncbi:MAG TPA: TonB-dependent receptor plug domain-containing protein, partial [Tenuifilaceae bacterium]|nr:TonB-dependent receptor plug domain-containing protein [Tenuifilaceae bacterium]